MPSYAVLWRTEGAAKEKLDLSDIKNGGMTTKAGGTRLNMSRIRKIFDLKFEKMMGCSKLRDTTATWQYQQSIPKGTLPMGLGLRQARFANMHRSLGRPGYKNSNINHLDLVNTNPGVVTCIGRHSTVK